MNLTLVFHQVSMNVPFVEIRLEILLSELSLRAKVFPKYRVLHIVSRYPESAVAYSTARLDTQCMVGMSAKYMEGAHNNHIGSLLYRLNHSTYAWTGGVTNGRGFILN